MAIDRKRLRRRLYLNLTAALGAWGVVGIYVFTAHSLFAYIMCATWSFVAGTTTGQLPRNYRRLRDYKDPEALPPKPEPQISCAYCGALYKAIDLATTQGENCASLFVRNKDTNVWYCESFYGSDYDMTLHRFVGAPPAFELDPVCDTCITSMLNQGRIVYEREVNEL